MIACLIKIFILTCRYIGFLDAKRHDSVGGLVSLAEFCFLNPDIRFKKTCLDSKNDNYATYELCKEWGINPFIDLNSNRGHPESIPKRLTVDGDGTPLCAADFRMVY
jgi:hypothetical protein